MLIVTTTYQGGDIPRGFLTHILRYWGGYVRSRDKLNTLYLHLQKTCRGQTKQGVDLQWQAPMLKATWHFDHVTHLTSRDNFKKLYFHPQKTYCQYAWQDANLWYQVQHVNAHDNTGFLLQSVKKIVLKNNTMFIAIANFIYITYCEEKWK